MLCGLAPTAGFLIAARVLQAVGAAALVPSSLALVLQTFPREKVPVAVAIWGAIGAVAGAFGPTLGALVVENFGWRWAFFINLPVGIVSFALGRRVLPEGREANPGRLPDPLGVVLLAAGLALAGVRHRQDRRVGLGQHALRRDGRSVGGADRRVLLALQPRAEPVARPRRCSTRSRSAGPTPAMLVYASGFSAMFLGNVLFLTEVWHYSILRAGMAISVGPLIVAVTAPFFGRLAGRIGQRALLVPGGLVWASGGVLLLVAGDHRDAATSASTCRRVVLTALGVSLCCRSCRRPRCRACRPIGSARARRSNQAVRNLGATLGVALVVAFTADADTRRRRSRPSTGCGGSSSGAESS